LQSKGKPPNDSYRDNISREKGKGIGGYDKVKGSEVMIR
jgi:hypothetical protein